MDITQNESTSTKRRIRFALVWAAGVQRVALNDIGAGDSFTLTFDGQTTAAINQSSDMTSDILAKLEALSNIASGDVSVAKVNGVQSYDVTFKGALAAASPALMTITPTGFTPTGISWLYRSGTPATSQTITASTDMTVSKAGATPAAAAGTAAEEGNGAYYYQATAGEVDTLGYLGLTPINRSEFAISFPTVQIIGTTTDTGSPVARSSTLQSATATSVTLDASASSVNDFYKYCLCYLRSGTGAGQARYITAYNGTTKAATIDPAWVTTPDSTTVFDLLPMVPFATVAEVGEAVRSNVIGGAGTSITTDANGGVSLAKHRTQ